MEKKKVLVIVDHPDSTSIKDLLEENLEAEIVFVSDLPARRASISSYAMVVSLLVSDYSKVVEALKEIPLATIQFPTLTNHTVLKTIASFISVFISRFKSDVPLFWHVSRIGVPMAVKFTTLFPPG